MPTYSCKQCGSKNQPLFCEACGNLIIKPKGVIKQEIKDILDSLDFNKKFDKNILNSYNRICTEKEIMKVSQVGLKALSFQSNPELGEKEFLKNPTLWYNWYGLGELRIHQGKIEQAILAKNRCLQLRPTLKLVLFEIGSLNLYLKRYELALESFLACRDDLFRFLHVHLMLVRTYMFLKKYDMAFGVVSDLIANKRLTKKKIKELWIWIAILFLKKPLYFNDNRKDYSELLKALDRCLEIDSEYQHAWRVKLRTYLKLHQYQSVINFCEENLHKYADNYYIWLYYAVALSEKGDNQNSNVVLYELLKFFPNESYLILRVGINHTKLKEFETAIRFLERYVKEDPKSINALNFLANSYFGVKDYDAMLKMSKKIIALDKDDALAWASLSSALLYKDELEEALTAINKSLELNPDYDYNYIIFSNKARIYIKMEKYSKAIESANKALSIKPGYYGALQHLGNAYYKLGNIEKANYFVDKSIESNNKWPSAWLLKARIFSDSNQLDKALEYCNISLELDPTFEKALEFKKNLEVN